MIDGHLRLLLILAVGGVMLFTSVITFYILYDILKEGLKEGK